MLASAIAKVSSYSLHPQDPLWDWVMEKQIKLFSVVSKILHHIFSVTKEVNQESA